MQAVCQEQCRPIRQCNAWVTRLNEAFNEIAMIGEISFTARINPSP